MEYDCSPVSKRRKILHGKQDPQVLGSRKKLLVLDVNGLLVDIVADADESHKPDTIIASKAVFKRPFCDEFLKFCFERFRVGVWTSRTRRNITRVLDFLMKDTQHQLLFCWDQSHCTETGFNTIENTSKPLLLKELKRLWEKQDPNLSWDRGVYDESNTLLLDDSPYKALCNPPYTAIFPYTYSYRDTQDNGLGPNGDLRNYLERLAASDNVQNFIEQNPFGQQPITRDNESWSFYHKIICSIQPGAGPSRPRKKLIVIDIGGLLVDVVTVPREGFRADIIHGSRAVFKRPYCDEFLQFCFERFSVGVWTTTKRYNTERALDYLMRDTQHKLLFCWDLSHCTDTGFRSVENDSKTIVLKDLRKLWEKKDPNLPWELGEYGESNTLLVENVPHKGLLNPPHTAIFPYPYRHWKTEDNSLGPNGDLRVYLERLAASENIQKFVSENPFGQRPIREKNLSWPYYQKVIHAFSYKRKTLVEPKPDSSTALAAPTLLEPETVTTTSPTLLESETITTAILTAPTLLEPETDTTNALVGQTLSEPEVNTTAPAAQILLKPETFTSDDAHSGFTKSSKGALTTDVGTSLSAKNKSFSPKRSGSNSAVNGSVTCSSNKRMVNKGNTKVIVSDLETSGSNDIHQDLPRHDIIITQIDEAEDDKSDQNRKRGRPTKLVGLMKTSEADDSKSCQKRKRGRPQMLVAKKAIGLLKGTTDLDEQPLSISYEAMHPLPVLKRSSCLRPLDKSLNQANTSTAGTATDYQQDWPFIKQSPIWPTIESLMSCLTPPQKPHFSSLKNTKEYFREGLAIGHMVTYWNIVQRLSRLKPNDPVDIIHTSLDTLVDLETHGFDVGSIRGCLNDLLSLKSKVGEHEDTRKELEKCEYEKLVMNREMGRLKVKTERLQEKTVQAETMQKVKEEEIIRLQSNLHLVSNQISDLKLAFEKLAATPL